MKTNRISHGRCLILCLLSLVLPLSLSAKIVTPSKALEIANSFFYQTKTMQAGSETLTLSWTSGNIMDIAKTMNAQDPAFYVFSSEDSKGFVIVSGDDAVIPIIGYSFDSPAPSADNIPVNMKEWLTKVAEIIYDARSRKQNPSLEVQKHWANPRPSSVVKQLKTATWDQGYPYNLQCPKIGGKQCVTGCVATSMATVMRYHQYPPKSKGTSVAYNTETSKIYVPSRDLNHTIDWSNMPLEYSGSATTAQKNEVARLMADLGAINQADYGTDGTGANVYGYMSYAYANYDYDPGATVLLKESYSDYQWSQLIKEDIDNNLPIIYSGDDPGGGGHAFVLDGYTDDSRYHFNWGWGGIGNGLYYGLDEMNPSGTPYQFTKDQMFIKGFKPLGSGPIVITDWLKLYKGLKSETKNIKQGEVFRLNDLYFLNTATVDFSGKGRVALTDSKGKVKEVLLEKSYSIAPDKGVGYEFIDMMISVSISDNDRIRCFYKEDSETDWTMMKSFNSSDPWEIVLSGTVKPKPIGDNTSLSFNRKTKKILVEFPSDVSATLYCGGSEWNYGVTVHTGSMTIDVNALDLSKKYMLRLKNSVETKDVDLNLKSL